MSLQQQLTQPLSLAGLLLMNSAPFQEFTKQRAASKITENTKKTNEAITKKAVEEHNKGDFPEAAIETVKEALANTQAATLEQARLSGKKGDIEDYLRARENRQQFDVVEDILRKDPDQKLGFEDGAIVPYREAKQKAQQHLAEKQQEKREKKGYISPSVITYDEMNRYDKHKFVGQLRKGGIV